MSALFTRSFGRNVFEWIVTFAVADLMYDGLLKPAWRRFRKTKSA